MRTITFLLLILTLVENASNAATDSTASFYSETNYLSESSNFINQSRLDFFPFQIENFPQIYAGFRIDQDTRSEPGTIYNDNRISPLLGARQQMPSIPIWGFAEYRQDLRYLRKPNDRPMSSSDARGGTFGYDFWELSRLAKSVTLFDEAYFEAIYSTGLTNAFGQGWNKIGVRTALYRGGSTSVWFDTYADALLKRSTLAWPGENTQEAGPAIRLAASARELSASLSARRGFGSRKDEGSFDHWSMLLVLDREF